MMPGIGEIVGASATNECIVMECGGRQLGAGHPFQGSFCQEHTTELNNAKQRNEMPRDMSRAALEAAFVWGSLILTDNVMRARGFDQKRASDFVSYHNMHVMEMFRRGLFE